jgi:hypothetical protein
MNIFSFCCFGRKRKIKHKPQVENFYSEPECQDECRELECQEECRELECREECLVESIIDIRDDFKILNNEIVVFDCMSINIMNCPKITAIPEIQYFQWLEVLIIEHCDIKECTTAFPSSLRNLTITYCNMEVFEPRCINITNLATIDLSFNKLEKIPIILGEYEGRLKLKNNNFWYNTYSGLQYSKVNNAHELAIAYKLNIISSSTVNEAIHILSEKKYKSEAKKLKDFMDTEFNQRKVYLKNTFNNPQNTHLVGVQNSTKKSIEYLMKTIPYTSDISELLNEATERINCDKIITFKKDIKHPLYKVSLYDIFSRVYTIARIHKYRDAILPILKDEIEEGYKTCLSGLISRIIGSLNGFEDDIKITISSREELLNSIVALRRNYSVKYGNSNEYNTEIIPVVWQMLEDFCIKESEHQEWLAYL